jgi:hypothetical protein
VVLAAMLAVALRHARLVNVQTVHQVKRIAAAPVQTLTQITITVVLVAIPVLIPANTL